MIAGRPHPLLMTALLAALFLRALVPDGFMPAAGEMVELCTLHGPRTVMTDPVTGELLAPEDDDGAPACPWSLILSTLAAPSLHSPGSDIVAATPPFHAGASLPAGRPSLLLPHARAPPPSA